MAHNLIISRFAAAIVTALVCFCIDAFGLDVDIHVNPALTFNPSSLAFGSTEILTAASPQSIVATNISPISLMINSASLTGSNAADFTITNNCVGNLAPQATCSITVGFKPSVSGSRNASLKLTGLPGHDYTAALSGSGSAALALILTPDPAFVPCDSHPGATVSVASVTGGNANPVVLSLTAGDLTDFALSGSAPPANIVIAPGGLPIDYCNTLPHLTATVTATQN